LIEGPYARVPGTAAFVFTSTGSKFATAFWTDVSRHVDDLSVIMRALYGLAVAEDGGRTGLFAQAGVRWRTGEGAADKAK